EQDAVDVGRVGDRVEPHGRRRSQHRAVSATALLDGSHKLRFMLDARKLRVLRAVAEHGSFPAAVAELQYTPSAISKQIAALEREAGPTLVERGPRGTRLTQAGAVLDRHASLVLG